MHLRHRGRYDGRGVRGQRSRFCVHCDVRDYDQVQESVQKVIDRYGRIDVLMNNAGICHREPFLECSKEGWLDVMATNLNGEFYVARLLRARWSSLA